MAKDKSQQEQARLRAKGAGKNNKNGKGGKGGGNNGLVRAIASATGLSPDAIRAAQRMSQAPNMDRFLRRESEAERYYNSAANNLKSDKQIANEQSEAYRLVREKGAQAQQSGANIGSAFASAMGAASGGLMNLAGGNAAAAQDLLNTGASAATGMGIMGNDLSRIGSAANDQALLQEQMGVTNARIMRDEKFQDSKEKARLAKDERLKALYALADTSRGNVLGILSNLQSLKNSGGSGSGGGGGYGSGGSGTSDGTDDGSRELTPAEQGFWNQGVAMEGLMGRGKKVSASKKDKKKGLAASSGGSADTRMPWQVKGSVANQVASQTNAAYGPVINAGAQWNRMHGAGILNRGR